MIFVTSRGANTKSKHFDQFIISVTCLIIFLSGQYDTKAFAASAHIKLPANYRLLKENKKPRRYYGCG